MPDFVLDAKLSKNSYAATPSVIDGWRPVILDTEQFNFSKADPQFSFRIKANAWRRDSSLYL